MNEQAFSEDDVRLMNRALEEARRGHPSPNPHVGALVVTREGATYVGHHERAGERHAEIDALDAAGAHAAGGTLYVTLEPCNHHGRTSPCTDAIVAAGIKRVVVACKDPNPHVTGGGIERLRAAGVEVVVGVGRDVGHALISPWAKWVTTGLPYVTLKLGLTLDGRIATRTGASKWVTGTFARAKVHALRAKNDVVAVGVGTAIADDPRLTVRDAPGLDPVRLVFDTHLRIPAEANLVKDAADVPTWVVCGEDASETRESMLRDFGVTVFRVACSAEGRVDPRFALQVLAERGVVKLMIEGGAELAGSFLAARLADELHAFIAPKMFGPRGRPGAVDWAGPETPAEAPHITSPIWELCGEDAYVHGRVLYT